MRVSSRILPGQHGVKSEIMWKEVRANTQPTAGFEAHIYARNSSSTGLPEHADGRHHKSSYSTKGKRCTALWIGDPGLHLTYPKGNAGPHTKADQRRSQGFRLGP